MFAQADKDNDGKLTVQEWKEMLKKTGAPVDEWVWSSNSVIPEPSGPLINLKFRKEIEIFFAEKDRDFDGRLSLEEFLGEETQIEKLFRLMDKNGDGFITKKVRRMRRETENRARLPDWLCKFYILLPGNTLIQYKAARGVITKGNLHILTI